MTELSIFHFEGQEIQVKGVGSTDTPEWIAADVGAVLGINHSTLSERVSKMPESWKGMYSIHTPGGLQQTVTVTEPGLYEVIFRSDKPAARRFRVWMFEEVLPSIRRTGSYSHPASQPALDPQLSQLIELAQTQVEVINEQQKMLATALADLTKAKSKKQPKWAPRSTSHLLEFVREVGLEPQPDGRVYVSDLWQQLQGWYIKAGVLKIEIVKSKENLIWRNLPNECDCPVKAINQLSRRFREIFPELRKFRHTGRDDSRRRGCNYLSGIGYCDRK